MTGGGTFVANGSFSVIDFGNSSSGSLATLDLSGLNCFIYNNSIGTMNIANATSGNRFGGLFRLAGVSNNVTAGTLNFLQNNVSNGGNGSSGLQFGSGTNIVNVGTLNVVGGKNTGTVKFIAGAPSTAGLRIRGVTGNADDTSRASITIAVRTSTGTGTTTGNLSLNGNGVDIKASSLLIGEDTQSGGNGANGTLSFDTGTVDATTIAMGHTGNAAVTAGVGTINVGAATATLIIGSGGLSMVNQASGAGAAGNLNITGGMVICSNNIIKTTTSGTATISLTDGTLNMVAGAIGTLPTPIDTLNLSDSGALDTKIQLNVVAGVTNICASAVNIVGGVTTINIASFTGVSGTIQIPLISYNNGSSPIAGLMLGTVPVGYTVSALIDNTGNQTIDVLVTPPAPTIWVGAVGSLLNGNWNISTLNWRSGATPVAYADVDFAQFDDTASNSLVTLTTTLSPASLDVSNNALNYTFSGSGKLHGGAALVKQGTGSLILDNTGSNDFTGGLNIVGGTVQFGNNDANGNLPVSGGIVDNGTLIFNRTDSYTVPNVISGSGALRQSGTGTNKLGAVNTYSGTTIISAGMIIATNANSGNSSIGSSAGVCVITNGGTLDIENSTAQALSFTNTTDTAGKQFFIAGAGVGGNGAIVNNGTANQQNAFQNIALTANATVGGPTRWDMRVPDGHYSPVLDLNGFTLTKTGSNQMSMVSLLVTNGGNIVINSGIFSFETTSSNSATHIQINAGGVMGHFRENAGYFTAPITLNGGMIRDLNGTPGSTNDSPITLTANSFLDLNVNSTDLLQLNGIISESGGSFGLTKTNVGSYSLSAANTYSGTTLVQQGKLILVDNGSISSSKTLIVASGATLDASQRTDGTLALAAGQTLNGFGTVAGIVTTASSSTIAPGSASALGVLTVSGNVTLSGTNLMKLNKTVSPSNDVLNVAGTLTYGGTLKVSSLGGAFTAGDSFQLFTAASYAGSFSATNLPTGGGLTWSWNPANGTLTVVTGGVNSNPTNITATVSGNVLTLSWPADHTGWTLQAQTNSLGAGLNPNAAAWFNVPGSASVNTINVTMDPAKGTVFYRLVLP
jgi:autotransporter-associated beta strand protein